MLLQKKPSKILIFLIFRIPKENLTGEYSRCRRYSYNYTAFLKDLIYSKDGSGEVNVSTVNPPSDAVITKCDNGWRYELEQYTTSVVADVSNFFHNICVFID